MNRKFGAILVILHAVCLQSAVVSTATGWLMVCRSRARFFVWVVDPEK